MSQIRILSFHFRLLWSVNSTSFLHLPQNSLDKCCTRLQCFLQHISADVKTPGGCITTLDFIVSRLIRLSDTKLVTSLITSVVSGRELTIASTSVNNVCKDASVKLSPCLFNNELKIFWAVLISRSQIFGAPKHLQYCLLVRGFASTKLVHHHCVAKTLQFLYDSSLEMILSMLQMHQQSWSHCLF